MSEIKKWDEVNGVDDSSQRMEAFLDSASDSYAILQLRRSEETVYERFSSMRELGRMGLEPDIDHYEVVCVGELAQHGDQVDALEGLYTQFKLSVSDIVALKVGGVVSSHYVDSIGFQELPEFIQRQNYLRNAEMALEDDYNMIDGCLNNGKKDEPVAEHPSILEQLKKYAPPRPAEPPYKNRTERDER